MLCLNIILFFYNLVNLVNLVNFCFNVFSLLFGSSHYFWTVVIFTTPPVFIQKWQSIRRLKRSSLTLKRRKSSKRTRSVHRTSRFLFVRVPFLPRFVERDLDQNTFYFPPQKALSLSNSIRYQVPTLTISRNRLTRAGEG